MQNRLAFPCPLYYLALFCLVLSGTLRHPRPIPPSITRSGNCKGCTLRRSVGLIAAAGPVSRDTSQPVSQFHPVRARLSLLRSVSVLLSSTIHRVPAVSHASFLDSHQHYFILSDPRFQTPITTNAFDSIQCVKLNPKWAKGYARKGAALHGAHKFSEAIAAYEAGIAIEDSPALQKGLKEVKEAQQRTS